MVDEHAPRRRRRRAVGPGTAPGGAPSGADVASRSGDLVHWLERHQAAASTVDGELDRLQLDRLLQDRPPHHEQGL